MTGENNPPPILQNRYRLVSWLGEGSMGVVYRAHDEFLDRNVAIKFLPPGQVSSGDRSVRFLREARTVARLVHPNIMTLFDVGQEENWHYLVLELLTGMDLYTYIAEKGGRLEFSEAIRIIRDLLKGLSYAHAENVLHRDIKPENVMVAPSGAVKITDFGLAVAQQDPRLTTDGAIVGTAQYIAPEILKGERGDQRTDLYALGALFYELITGQAPFAGEELAALFAQVLYGTIPAPNELVPEIPAQLTQIVVKLLQRDPAERYASADEVLSALDEAAGNGNAAASADLRTTWESDTLLVRVLTGSSRQLKDAAEAALERDLETEDANQDAPLDQALMLYAALEDTAAALEAERRRLAVLLTRDVVEPLNLLMSQASTYEQTLGTGNPHAKMVASVLTTLARQTLQQARDIENYLHPVALDTLGFEPALETLVGQIQRTNGIAVAVNTVRLQERLPAPVELALFRISQAAFERAVRVGHASQAEVHLSQNDEYVSYRFIDNSIVDAGQDILQASLQRVQQIGGQLEVSWEPQRGLDLRIRFQRDPAVTLTPREMETVQLVAEGLSNKQIAQALVISPRTVNYHLDNIYTKLGVNSRTEAAIYAIRRGWIRPFNINNL